MEVRKVAELDVQMAALKVVMKAVKKGGQWVD